MPDSAVFDCNNRSCRFSFVGKEPGLCPRCQEEADAEIARMVTQQEMPGVANPCGYTMGGWIGPDTTTDSD